VHNLNEMGKTSHQNLNDLVKELSDHLQKLNDGKLKLDEIEGLVNSAKEIYERLIVVRHKAYENFGAPSKKEQEQLQRQMKKWQLQRQLKKLFLNSR